MPLPGTAQHPKDGSETRRLTKQSPYDVACVVDLALQIAYPKPSATRRRECGTHLASYFAIFPLHDSGGTMVQLVLMPLHDVPADRRPDMPRIILHSPCCVTLDWTVRAHDIAAREHAACVAPLLNLCVFSWP
jgi:hypothetical protein